MTLQQIKEQDRIKFLQNIVDVYAKQPEKFRLLDWDYEIRHSCDKVDVDAGFEDDYDISYQNKQILDPHETKDNKPVCIQYGRLKNGYMM